MVIKNLLEIDNLKIRFMSDPETVDAVNDISIKIRSGEVLGIVGESGAGKSTIGNAIINLLDAPGEIVKGKVIFEGQNLVGMDDKAMRTIRGKKIGMIFQDPQTSLNPIMTIGNQLIETIKFTIAFPIVDFPAPLSPTIPRTSPDLSVIETSLTAFTVS